MNDPMKRVLVIMTTFNSEKWIEDQLNSILNQHDVSIYLSIFDDGSTDKTISILERYSQRNDNIRVELNELPFRNPGKNFINAVCLNKSEDYDYFAFSDHDDIWKLDKIKSAIDKLVDEHAEGYSCSVTPFTNSKLYKDSKQCSSKRKLDFIFEGAGQGCTFVLSNKLYNNVRKFFINNKEEIAPFYYHDWLVYIFARNMNMKWFFDERSFIYYRQHAHNNIGSKFSLSSIMKRYELIINGWYKSQICTALKLSNRIASNEVLHRFTILFNSKKSIQRKLRMATYIFQYGRRKIIERIILVFFVLSGHI